MKKQKKYNWEGRGESSKGQPLFFNDLICLIVSKEQNNKIK